MENVVTPETAQRLKAAGFPQPKINIGQAWYLLDYDTESPYIAHSPHMNKPTMDGSGGRHFDFFSPLYARSLNWAKKPVDHLVYAPTAPDIMKQLGQKYVLWYDENPKMQMWFCAKTADLPQEAQQPFGHANPAEAAAMAFLDKKASSRNGK